LLIEATGGRLLFSGRITDVERRTASGFARGRVTIRGAGSSGSEMQIDFQNENLVARVDDQAVAMVPDLICICRLR
jgi:DUF917 family protein